MVDCHFTVPVGGEVQAAAVTAPDKVRIIGRVNGEPCPKIPFQIDDPYVPCPGLLGDDADGGATAVWRKSHHVVGSQIAYLLKLLATEVTPGKGGVFRGFTFQINKLTLGRYRKNTLGRTGHRHDVPHQGRWRSRQSARVRVQRLGHQVAVADKHQVPGRVVTHERCSGYDLRRAAVQTRIPDFGSRPAIAAGEVDKMPTVRHELWMAVGVEPLVVLQVSDLPRLSSVRRDQEDLCIVISGEEDLVHLVPAAALAIARYADHLGRPSVDGNFQQPFAAHVVGQPAAIGRPEGVLGVLRIA